MVKLEREEGILYNVVKFKVLLIHGQGNLSEGVCMNYQKLYH